MRDLVILGAGGHGRELFATVMAINAVESTWHVLGFVDDAPTHTDRVERLGSRILGTVEWLAGSGTAGEEATDHEGPVSHDRAVGATYALGVGTSTARRRLVARLDTAGLTAATVIHPSARVGPDCQLGEGVVIYEGSSVTTNVQIGDHTHLNVGCVIQHDSMIGEFVQFSPGVFVNGDCTIGDDVFLGTGAIITRGCEVGEGARVGAGAVVLDDVEPGATVVGVPARIV